MPPSRTPGPSPSGLGARDRKKPGVDGAFQQKKKKGYREIWLRAVLFRNCRKMSYGGKPNCRKDVFSIFTRKGGAIRP